MRTLVIGDIHGSIQSLTELLDKAAFDTTKDRLICLGDYIDGWEGAAQVVDLLLGIEQKSLYAPIFILGNHDSWLIDVLNKDFDHFRDQKYIRSNYPSWIRQGGEATYLSYLQLSDEEIMHHRDAFYNKLRAYFLEDNYLFVHAGFDSLIGFEETVRHAPLLLQWDRSLYEKAFYYWQMETFHEAEPSDIRFGDFERIYIGHTPTFRNGLTEPAQMLNVLNLDQGCKATGRLTGWIHEEGRFFQSGVL
ncbi:MAG: metallophosphoesterase [Bacteroidota bacterium]